MRMRFDAQLSRPDTDAAQLSRPDTSFGTPAFAMKNALAAEAGRALRGA
jgi:hypothetical protein